jgi:hypothetical protein
MPGSRVAALSVLPLLLAFGSPAAAALPERDPAALPDYQTPIVADRRPPEVPHDGMGAFGFAGVSFGYALLGFGGAASLIVRDDSPVFWGLALGAAIPATLMGATAVAVGVRNQRRHYVWVAQTGIEPPRQGNGLVGTGAMLLIGGSAAVTIGALSRTFNAGIEFSEPTPTPLDPIAIGIGVTSVVVGSGLLIAGSSRAGRFKRWRAEQVSVLPTFAPTRGGFGFGVAGRF